MINHAKPIIVLALGLLSAGALTLAAQTRGDAEKGYRLAKGVCAECHAVEKNESDSPNNVAPNFTAIARSPGMSEIALSVFLRTPHDTMPNLVLSGDEVTDVIAYIESLKD
jgi:mono/diheme cytochrome c family protein